MGQIALLQRAVGEDLDGCNGAIGEQMQNGQPRTRVSLGSSGASVATQQPKNSSARKQSPSSPGSGRTSPTSTKAGNAVFQVGAPCTSVVTAARQAVAKTGAKST